MGQCQTNRLPLADIRAEEEHMNGIIYIVGLVVIVMFILGYFGLR